MNPRSPRTPRPRRWEPQPSLRFSLVWWVLKNYKFWRKYR